jgi:hypothetical protein
MGRVSITRGQARPTDDDIRTRAPYDTSVARYLDAGWLMPIPCGGDDGKTPLESGFHGWKSDWKKQATKQNARRLHKHYKGRNVNIGLWPAPGLLLIDIDAYDKKHGWETLTKLEEEFGKLPDTLTSSARSDGKSGIRWFNVPIDLDLHGIGVLGDGIEVVHRGTRFAVIPPSYHKGRNAYYRWYLAGDPIDGEGSYDVPDREEVSELPFAWVEMLRHRHFSRFIPEKKFKDVPTARRAVDKWVTEHGGEPCAKMLRNAEPFLEFVREKIQRHDHSMVGVYKLVCLAAEQHTGLATVIQQLRETFEESRQGDAISPAEVVQEWERFLDGGVRKVMTREDSGEFIGSECTCPPLGSNGRPRPDLNVNMIDLPTAIPECYRAMAACAETNWFGMYSKSGRPFLINQHCSEEIDVDTMRTEIMRYVHCYKPGPDGRPPAPQAPGTPFLMSMVKSAEGLGELPELNAIKSTPFFAKVNGKPQLVHTNGYHPEAKAYLQMDPQLSETVEHMTEVPDDNMLFWARRWLGDVFEGFPFRAEADRAGLYAALILPFARDLINGATPLHFVGAPSSGTGKTLLCDAISLIVCGGLDEPHGRHMYGMSKDRDRNTQLDKWVTAALRHLPIVTIIDNIPTIPFDSSNLASALTNEMYQPRILGKSESRDMPNRTLWLANGNNLSTSPDIQRRVVPISVDDSGERDRTFKIQNLKECILENRHRLVWSVLMLIANWVYQGCPPPDRNWKSLRGYEAWGEVIGGILFANGINDLLANRDEFVDDSTDEYHSIVELLTEWETTFGLGKKTSARDALNGLQCAQEMVDVSKTNSTSVFGAILCRYRNVPQADYILRVVLEKGFRYYRLERVGRPTVVRRGRPRGSKTQCVPHIEGQEG